MPIIEPPQVVTVDTGHLATVVYTVRAAHHLDYRREIVSAAGLLKESLLIPRILGNPTVEVFAEELWWVIQAAEELGNDQALSPIGVLFTAVDRLQYALDHQAARTDRGMVAVLEFECLVEAAAHTGEDTDRA